MSMRIMYLEVLAETVGRDYKALLKKEASYFIEEFCAVLEPMGGNEHYSHFGCSYNLYTGKKGSRHLVLRLQHKHCHLYFNDNIDYEFNIFHVLRHEFLLSKVDVQDALAKGMKTYFKTHEFTPERRLKVFQKSL